MTAVPEGKESQRHTESQFAVGPLVTATAAQELGFLGMHQE